jgi:SMODS-associated and fused to various effectors sensor domain
MGEQSAARLEGDDYQHLFSWYEALQLLDPDRPWESAHVEHPSAGAADDVVLSPRSGSGVPTKYMQVKWHVSHAKTYSFESLCEVVSGSKSLLEKLFASWKRLRAHGPIEVWLVSNWSLDPDLGGFIDAKANVLHDGFFDGGPTSKAGRARAAWATTLGATPEELESFCRALRFRLGYGSISELEIQVDDRMARHGLQTGQSARFTALGLVRKWIQAGGGAKRITAESLRAAIKEANLQAKAADAPPLVLWIHGWAKRTYDVNATTELDWTSFFDVTSRRVPTQTDWDDVLGPALVACHKQFAALPVKPCIDFRGKLPLTSLLAVGAEFPEVAGFSFRAEQPTRGETHLWRSDAPPTARRFETTEEPGDAAGRHLLVVLSITGDATKDARELIGRIPGGVKAMVLAAPDGGPGDGAIGSAGDATALAVGAKNLIRAARQAHDAVETHLVVYAPASYCLFLGQRLNALGDVVAYERAATGGYQPSLIVRTR